MARSYNQKKSGKGGLISIICILLVLLLVVGALGWLSKGFKDWTVKDWFSKTETTAGDDDDDEDDEGETATAIIVDSGGDTFVFELKTITAEAETAFATSLL